MRTRVSMLFKSCASPDMLSFSLCNKKILAIRHMNGLLFPTTLSIPSYDIGKEERLRTYQHTHVEKMFIYSESQISLYEDVATEFEKFSIYNLNRQNLQLYNHQTVTKTRSSTRHSQKHKNKSQTERPRTYNVRVRRVRANIVAAKNS